MHLLGTSPDAQRVRGPPGLHLKICHSNRQAPTSKTLNALKEAFNDLKKPKQRQEMTKGGNHVYSVCVALGEERWRCQLNVCTQGPFSETAHAVFVSETDIVQFLTLSAGGALATALMFVELNQPGDGSDHISLHEKNTIVRCISPD